MKPTIIKWTMILISIMTMIGCAETPKIAKKDYSQFRQNNPKTILIVPAVNRSVEVDAPDYFLSTIVRPVVERGYYVFPINVVKRLMEDDGLSDANLVHRADPTQLGEIFGADAILYVTIERWDAQYAILSTQVTVEFTYILKSGKTGELLWHTTERMVYSPQQNNNSSGNIVAELIVSAVAAALTKAIPNYIPLTQQANALAVSRPGKGLPAGPYREDYQKDFNEF